MAIYGLDVSHYQGAIDWNKVKADGKKFAILKVSQGSTLKDSRFEEYYNGAKAAGIPIGVYIYNKVTTVSKAEAEANFAVKCLAGKTLELGVWLDMEDGTMRGLGKTMLNSIIEKESSILRAAGFMVNIYCNRDWYVNILDINKLSSYKFWIARYPSGDNGTLKIGLKTNYMDIWQYSSKGKVSGIAGNVDLNIMYDEELIALVEYGTPVSVQKNPYKTPTTSIKKGSKGEGAKWVQWELNRHGASLVVDGDFGTKSHNALVAFQSANGLTADGICGKITREALKK